MKRKLKIHYLFGGVLLFLSIAINKWTLNEILIFILDRQIDTIRIKALYSIQILSFLLGLSLFFLNDTKKYLESIRPQIKGIDLFFAACFLIPNVIFWLVAGYWLGLDIFSPFGLYCLAVKIVGSSLIFYSVFIFTSKIHMFFSVFFGIIYVLFVCVESVLVFFAHERFELKFLHMILGADFSMYLTWKTGISIPLILGCTFFFARRVSFIARRERLYVGCNFFVIALFLFFYPMLLSANVIYTIPFKSVERFINLDDVVLFQYIHDDPVARVIRVLLTSKKHYNKVTALSRNNLEVARKYNLFIKGQYKADKNFNRIIVVTAESLSSAYLHLGENSSLMPNYNSYLDKFPSCPDYKTTSTTTMNGLSVTWCSHPNASLLRNLGMVNSFVTELREDGWLTAFLRSDPENFENGIKHIANAGFSIHRGKNYYKRKYHKYISNWGVPDRFIYNEAVDFLDVHRNEKVYLQLLGADTHLPYGRDQYFDFEYPDPPEWIIGHPHENLLKSVFFHDYDTKIFIDNIIKRGLLDPHTLIVLTADHSLPIGMLRTDMKGFEHDLDSIPLIFITSENLPDFHKTLNSQVDLAPTLLSLAGVDSPKGYWGKNLFTHGVKSRIGRFKESIFVETTDMQYTININEPKNGEEKNTIELFNSILLNDTVSERQKNRSAGGLATEKHGRS